MSKIRVKECERAVLFIRTDDCLAFSFNNMNAIPLPFQALEQNFCKIRICSDEQEAFIHI